MFDEPEREAIVARAILSAKASIADVETVFSSSSYEIPTYQREFSWEDKHVNALMDDLFEAYASRSLSEHDALPQYFLGAIVTQVREGNVADKIVDGQQRITCLLLLLSALSCLGSENTRSNLLKLIYRPDRDAFILNEPGYNYYLRKMMGGKDGLPPLLLGAPPFRTAALQKLERAQSVITNRLKDHLLGIVPGEANQSPASTDLLDDFANWTINYVFVALIADTDPYDEQRLFDRINTRGLPLSEGARFMSRVLASSGRRLGDGGSKDWRRSRDEAMRSLNSAGQTGAMAVRDPMEAERRLFSSWLIATALDLSADNPQQVHEAREIRADPYDWCLDDTNHRRVIGTRTNLYEALRLGYFPYPGKCSGAYKSVYAHDPRLPGLHHAQIVKLPYLDAAIAACYAAKPSRSREARLRHFSEFADIVSFHRAWNPSWLYGSRLEGRMLKVVEALRRCPEPQLRSQLKEIVGHPPHIEQGNAPALFAANQRWIRYFLGRICVDLERRLKGRVSTHAPLVGAGGDTPEIEHILSVNFTDYGASFGFNRSQIEEYRQRLGALTILPRTANRRASNKALDVRMQIYAEKGSWLLTNTLHKSFYDNHLKLTGARQGAPDHGFRPWASITPEAIEAREAAYTALARDIWRY